MSILQERRDSPQIPEGYKIQDAGSKLPDPLPPGAVVFYHTHGYRQYFGTCKLHKNPSCRHLAKWEPGYVARGAWPKNATPAQKKKFQLGKTIMREWTESEKDVPVDQRCRTCWSTVRASGSCAEPDTPS